MGIIAEIERERHLSLVRIQVHALLQRVYSLSNQEQISETSVLGAEHYSVNSWVSVSQLRNGLESWKEQLQKMIAHITDLEAELQTIAPTKVTEKSLMVSNIPMVSCPQGVCIQSGRRIRKRLLEIVTEYDSKIRECNLVIDGVSLAAQMVSLSWVVIT